MRLLFCCILGTIALAFGVAWGLQSDGTSSLSLEDGGEIVESDSPLASISAVVHINQQQRLASGGILFVVEMSNQGEEEATLRNPLDLLSYLLIDEEGRAVQLPPRGIKFVINTRLPVDTQVFRVVDLELNGESVTERNNESATVTLPSHAVYRMTLLIEKVESSEFAPVPISPGEYSFRVSLGLTQPAGGGTRLLHTPTMQLSLMSDGQ